jgi:hypothetical protein
VGTEGYIPWGKAQGNEAGHSIQCRGQEKVKVYIHSSTVLHGVVLKQLSTEIIIFYFTFFEYIQTGSGPHPAPSLISNEYPKVKRPGRETEYSHPSNAEVKIGGAAFMA